MNTSTHMSKSFKLVSSLVLTFSQPSYGNSPPHPKSLIAPQEGRSSTHTNIGTPSISLTQEEYSRFTLEKETQDVKNLLHQEFKKFDYLVQKIQKVNWYDEEIGEHYKIFRVYLGDITDFHKLLRDERTISNQLALSKDIIVEIC